MRILLVVCALVLAGATPVLAQSNSGMTAQARDDRLVKSVTVEDLKAIVLAEGHTVNWVGKIGPVSVGGKTREGLLFDLIGRACEEPGVVGCLGIAMQVTYDIDSRLTTEKVNLVNSRYWAASVWIDVPGNRLVINRYVILDEGITMLNIRTNLSNALAINANVQKEVW